MHSSGRRWIYCAPTVCVAPELWSAEQNSAATLGCGGTAERSSAATLEIEFTYTHTESAPWRGRGALRRAAGGVRWIRILYAAAAEREFEAGEFSPWTD